MSIKLVRPFEQDGIRLFYRSYYAEANGYVGGKFVGHSYVKPKERTNGNYRLLEVGNVMAQVRLYRWFVKEYERAKKKEPLVLSGMILKQDLMKQCFSDQPIVHTRRVGRLLRMIVQYDVNFQRNARASTNFQAEMYWRWPTPVDFIYGLEHLMKFWLPGYVKADGGTCETTEDLLEEFELLVHQSEDEDIKMVNTIIDRRLY